MRNIKVIAHNTFKETIRDRIFYGIFGFAAVFIFFSLFLGSISLGEDIHVIKSLGLAGIYFFSMIITIFLGSSLIYKEYEKKTLYFVMSKPVTETEVILGKFAGLLVSTILSTLLMTGFYLLVVRYSGGGWDRASLGAILLQSVEMMLLIALLTLCSVFSRPLAAMVYAIFILYIGHSLGILYGLVKNSGWFTRELVTALYYLLPNLEKFNIRNLVIYQVPIPAEFFLFSVLYGIFYTAVLLYLAVILFKKREF